MKAKVTEQGVVMPKAMLEEVDEVDIRKERDSIVIVPTLQTDPILELGQHPVTCGTPDASENHDRYL